MRKGRATKGAAVFTAMATAISYVGSEGPGLPGLLEKLEVQIFRGEPLS